MLEMVALFKSLSLILGYVIVVCWVLFSISSCLVDRLCCSPSSGSVRSGPVYALQTGLAVQSSAQVWRLIPARGVRAGRTGPLAALLCWMDASRYSSRPRRYAFLSWYNARESDVYLVSLESWLCRWGCYFSAKVRGWDGKSSRSW